MVFIPFSFYKLFLPSFKWFKNTFDTCVSRFLKSFKVPLRWIYFGVFTVWVFRLRVTIPLIFFFVQCTLSLYYLFWKIFSTRSSVFLEISQLSFGVFVSYDNGYFYRKSLFSLKICILLTPTTFSLNGNGSYRSWR